MLLFEEPRKASLRTWESLRVDPETKKPWEHGVQLAASGIPHPNCGRPHCGTHVSAFCSFNDRLENLTDLLRDPSCDDIDLDPKNGLPELAGSHDDPQVGRLFRYYTRVLWAAEVLLDESEQIAKKALGKNNVRPELSKATTTSEKTPLDIGTLHNFINHAVKHGLKSPRALHVWNHHNPFFFEDAGCSLGSGQQYLTAHKNFADSEKPFGVIVPKLDDIVATVALAVRHLVELTCSDRVALTRIVAAYGRCW